MIIIFIYIEGWLGWTGVSVFPFKIDILSFDDNNWQKVASPSNFNSALALKKLSILK